MDTTTDVMSLVDAACRLRMSWPRAHRLVLTGAITGRKTNRGWEIDAASVAAYERRNGAGLTSATHGDQSMEFDSSAIRATAVESYWDVLDGNQAAQRRRELLTTELPAAQARVANATTDEERTLAERALTWVQRDIVVQDRRIERWRAVVAQKDAEDAAKAQAANGQ